VTTEQLAIATALDRPFVERGTFLPHLRALPRRSVQRCVKHALDRVAAALLLLLTLPLVLAVVLAVRLTSPGPAIYRQERVGQDGETFTLWKFRTMVQDADRWLPDLLHRHDRHREPLFKIPDDPRVTVLGRWLRRYSLDELPQLVNVLRGEMSLVGPRPQRPAEVALYGPMEHRRLWVRPGLTGLWQVSGRSSLSWESAVLLDLRYVDDWSLWSDVRILARTPRAVVRGQGAC